MTQIAAKIKCTNDVSTALRTHPEPPPPPDDAFPINDKKKNNPPRQRQQQQQHRQPSTPASLERDKLMRITSLVLNAYKIQPSTTI